MYTSRTQGIILLCIVIAMYVFAHKYSLYYIFWWYDWVQHFIGGMSLGLIGYSLWQYRPTYLLGLTGFCAISWEVFERIGHVVMPRFIGYGGVGDTTIDILCALVGTGIILWMMHTKKISE